MTDMSNVRIHTHKDGITLLVTLLVMGILLAISSSLLNITLKQYQISGIGLASEMAFQAASAGMECALYYDTSLADGGKFDIGTGAETLECFEDTDNTPDAPESGDEQVLSFDWGTPALCTEISVFKFFTNDPAGVELIVDGVDVRSGTPCPAGSTCTVVQARGYNVACGNKNSIKVVERELTLVY